MIDLQGKIQQSSDEKTTVELEAGFLKEALHATRAQLQKEREEHQTQKRESSEEKNRDVSVALSLRQNVERLEAEQAGLEKVRTYTHRTTPHDTTHRSLPRRKQICATNSAAMKQASSVPRVHASCASKRCDPMQSVLQHCGARYVHRKAFGLPLGTIPPYANMLPHIPIFSSFTPLCTTTIPQSDEDKQVLAAQRDKLQGQYLDAQQQIMNLEASLGDQTMQLEMLQHELGTTQALTQRVHPLREELQNAHEERSDLEVC